MICMERRHPWYSQNKYESHLIITRLLSQDTEKKLHQLAISNHKKLHVLRILRLRRNKYAIMFQDKNMKHIYYYKMKKNKEPLLSKKVSI